MRGLLVAPRAQRDIDAALTDSAERHGLNAALRYRHLIDIAFADLRQDPLRPTARRVEGGTLWLYALRVPARRLAAPHRVNAPPHVIAYRFDAERVRVLRVLHEAMDLPRHLKET